MKCINEYIELGHAIEVQKAVHLIPHHPVIKETSLTTSLTTKGSIQCIGKTNKWIVAKPTNAHWSGTPRGNLGSIIALEDV